MEFVEWEPVYERVIADFGFERTADERSREVLRSLVADAETFDTRLLRDLTAGRTVAVAGAGPSLVDETERAAAADVVFAASTAADTLREAGVQVDFMVTDLDKNPETVRDRGDESLPVAVHAHGDNVPAVERWVPEFDPAFVVPTTQAAPSGPVVNFGGFTDGDRAAFAADELGAGRLTFVGWDFDDPSVGPVKAKKLRWAERLLRWLERRRDERFDVLDGRRDRIDLSFVDDSSGSPAREPDSGRSDREGDQIR